MRDMPNAFWAASFIFIAAVIAVIVLFSPAPENIKQNVLTLCSSVVTGAFGYIQGKRDAADAITVPPNTTSTTTLSVTPNPTQVPPKEQ